MSRALEIERMKLEFYEELEDALKRVGGISDFTKWRNRSLEEILETLIPNGVRFGVTVLPREQREEW